MMTLILATALAGQAYEVRGEGYFRLERAGEIVYTASGTFHMAGGLLTHESGLPVSPPVRLPSDEFTISSDGRVICNGRTIGELVLARFEERVRKPGVFKATGKPRIGGAGESGFGFIQQASNMGAEANATCTIVMPETVEVAATTVTIGDIAKVSGGLAERVRNIKLCELPRAGEERLITRVTLTSSIRDAGLDPSRVAITMPVRVIVRRISSVVEPNLIEKVAREWLAANMPDNAALPLATQITQKSVPAGELELKITSSRDLKSAILLTYEGSIGGRQVLAGQLVFNKGAAPASSTPGSLRVGQSVRVLLMSNGVTVEAQGRIVTIGADASATVMIEETKATLIGAIRADGVVEVKL
jgi:hypothetical protein